MIENSLKDIQETRLSTSPGPPLQSPQSAVSVGTLSRDEMERRRMQAAEDFLHGLSDSHVVAKFGVSRTTASRWHRALTSKGLEALRKGKATGRPSRLTPEQKAQITDVFEPFEQGASALGFTDNRWTHTTRKNHRGAFQRALQSGSRHSVYGEIGVGTESRVAYRR
jgi:transposase